MAHVPSPRLLLTLPLLCPPLLAGPLACDKDSQGDDLPPGAFTSGPEDDGPAPTSDTSTSVDPSSTSDTTTSSATEESGSSEGPPLMLSHEVDILPIWNTHCIDAACHDADAPQAGLDIASPGVFERLCEGDHNFSGMRYIDCVGHDPENSYAFRKIDNTHLEGISGGSGLPMPPTQDMTAQEIETIRAWIEGGTLP